jgi:hypothetical protein
MRHYFWYSYDSFMSTRKRSASLLCVGATAENNAATYMGKPRFMPLLLVATARDRAVDNTGDKQGTNR